VRQCSGIIIGAKNELLRAVWPALSVSLIAFVTAALAVGWLARSRAAQLALDEPNARSLHTTPVPRTGGLGLLCGIATGWLLASAQLPGLVWAGLAIVIVVSLLDDLRGLSAALRFTTHLLAATFAAIALVGVADLLLLAAAVFAIGWMCNLYNFMDGADGLAGGMATFGFLAYALAAWLAGNAQFALLNLALATAAAGFLVHNFHPARIFLGDAGAVPLGFLAAVLGLAGWLQREWPWWFPLLVFSPFIVDASLTLVRRLFAGARIWEAHRDHYYQRLVLLGLGHRNTALAEYALMAACALAALWGMTLETGGQHVLLGAAALVYIGLIVKITLVWRTRGKAHA